MSHSSWRLLAQLLETGVTPASLPQNLESVIAERLSEALAAPGRSELDSYKTALADFFAALLARAPAETVAAVQGASGASETNLAAFSLGQIAFAQHAAAQAAERRADDRFTDVFTNPTLVTYVKALAKKDFTGRELANELDVREETVSRRLAELRELGVVDYRRDGTRLYNFLTPQARAAFEGLVEPDALPHRDPVKVRLVKRRQGATSETFQTWPTLSNPAILAH